MVSTPLFPEIVNGVHPAAPYIGGKRKLARRICRAIDRVPHRSYAEVFLGMGGVFLRRSRAAPAEFVNDWSEDVSTFFRILQRHYVAFLDMLRFQLSTRAGFERLLKVDPSTQTDLERAARFLYLQRLAFGGKVTGRSFGVDPYGSSGFDVSRLAPLLESIHERLAPVTIERLPWSSFVARYDTAETLFYLDPPYYGCETDYGADLFGRDQFELMAAQLATIEGKFLLSLNDHPDVRAIFAGFGVATLNVTYTVGGGDNVQHTSEVVISNIDQARLETLLA
jgi:DNA adenine methylase